MSTMDQLLQYRADYLKWMKRKATDPLVVEPDRKPFPARYQYLIDDMREEVHKMLGLGKDGKPTI